MRIRLIALTCALAAPMWMACGETDSDGASAPELQPLTVEEVPQTSANNVESMVDGAADAMAFVEDTDFMDTITDMFGGDEASDCVTWDEMTGEEMPCDDMDGEGDDGSMAEGLSDMAKDVADWLKDDVLVDGTESEDGLTVTYVISPETICDFGGDDDEHPEPIDSAAGMMPMEPADEDSDEGDQAMPEIEPEDEGKSCEEVFTEEPVALAVTSTGEGKIDIAVLFGQDQLSPINFFFHSTQLGVEVDLGKTLDVLAVYAAAVGEDAPELPVTLTGAVAATLTKDADKVYTIGASITQKITVNGTMDDASYSLSIGKSDPLVALTMDGVNESMTAAANVGAIDVSAPASWLDGGCESEGGSMAEPMPVSPPDSGWDDEGDSGEGDEDPWMEDDHEMYDDPCEEEEPLTGTYEAHLGGASASVTMDGKTEAISLNNLGLGDTTTTVSRNGDTLIGVDLNEAHGRTLDLTIHSDENAMNFQLDPALVVSVALSLAGADGIFEGAPSWMHDEVMTVSLTGSSPEVRLDFGDEESESEGGFSVVSGTLTLSSTSVEDVVVEAGMCIVGVEEDDHMEGMEEPHEDWDEEEEEEAHLFSEIQAGACE